MPHQQESVLQEHKSTMPSQAPEPSHSAHSTSIPRRSQVSAETRAKWIKMRSEVKMVEAKSDTEVERKCLDFADRLLEAMDARIAAGGTIRR